MLIHKVNKLKEAENRVDQQIATELYYSKKAVDNRIVSIIDNDDDILDNLAKAIDNIQMWALMFDGYDSKRKRLDKLLESEKLTDIVKSALVMVMKLCEGKDLLSSIAGQLAGQMTFMETTRDAVITAAEILALMDKAELIYIDSYDNTYEDPETGEVFNIKSKYVSNPWEINESTQEHIRRAMFPLPMITRPQKLKHNKSNGYLTVAKESLILGKGNYHEERISLDVLNKLNSVELCINTDMLSLLTDDLVLSEEDKAAMIANPKRKEQYERFTKESAFAMAYLVNNGNSFYLTHKFDKRGRTYSSGYHVNTQGNSLQKSVIDLANKEVINGSFE